MAFSTSLGLSSVATPVTGALVLGKVTTREFPNTDALAFTGSHSAELAMFAGALIGTGLILKRIAGRKDADLVVDDQV
ncbi:MAG: hypothetical protein KDB86_04805 [Actinobacteria bacterium]|nr:hypothetical protein [Actinomycetota bacterium]